MKLIETNLNYNNRLVPLDTWKVKYIVLHHAEAKVASVEDIHRWHLGFGWSGFGYNEYIRKDGTVYIGRGMHIGAQCHKHNSISYGIALEGNFRVEEPTQEQLISLSARIEAMKFHFPNFIEVKNHRDLVDTECPVIDLKEIVEHVEDERDVIIDDLHEIIATQRKSIFISECLLIEKDNEILKLTEYIENYKKEETRLGRIITKTRKYIALLRRTKKK